MHCIWQPPASELLTGLIDFDVVDHTNLHRQILFGTEAVGMPKVEAAKKVIQSINPNVKVNTYNEMLTSKNAMEIFKDYDLIIDGTDNFPTRYLVNDACVFLNKTNIYGSIFRFEGQATVFQTEEDGPCYRCCACTRNRRHPEKCRHAPKAACLEFFPVWWE